MFRIMIENDSNTVVKTTQIQKVFNTLETVDGR